MGHYACDMRPEWFAQDRPEPPKLTDWFPPELKPVRSGYFLSQFFDAGWMYDWMVYWDNDRQQWLDREGGSSLIDQNLTWRGMEKPNDEQL